MATYPANPANFPQDTASTGYYFAFDDKTDGSHTYPYYARYELRDPNGNYHDTNSGFVIRWNSTTNKNEINVNDSGHDHNSNDPSHYKVDSGSVVGTNTWSEIESGSTVTLYQNASGTTWGDALVIGTSHLWSTSSGGGGSGPTVTSITIVTPYEFNDGVNNFWVDGEFVTNDTITASDCTLYKDFSAYANSNITIVGNKFGITKSGTAVYGISVGGAHATVDYVDDSWIAALTSNSSGRSTNALRIKEVLAKIPDDVKMYLNEERYSPQHTGLSHARGPWVSGWQDLDSAHGWQRIKFESLVRFKKVFSTNPFNISPWYPNPHTVQYQFEVAEIDNEIQWRFTRYKYWNDLSQNHGASDNVLTSPWFEVGAHPNPKWVWSYDQNETRYGVSVYDSWNVDERFWVAVGDWVYYQEPEGDDEGPDGNPPYNTPPGDNPPNDPTDDPDPPKHQYPGDNWPRRRRAHSFW